MAVLVKPSPGNQTQGFNPTHYALDYGWGNGDTVYASAAGTVDVKWSDSYGWTVTIDHGNLISGKTTITRCRHLSAIGLPKDGITVKQGQAIATQGSTGSFAIRNGIRQKHLHFELLVNGVKTNPEPYYATTSGGGGTPITPDAETEEDDMQYRAIIFDGAPGSGPLYGSTGIMLIPSGRFKRFSTGLADRAAFSAAQTYLNALGFTKEGGTDYHNDTNVLEWSEVNLPPWQNPVPVGGTVPTNLATHADIVQLGTAIGTDLVNVHKEIAAVPKAVNDEAAKRLAG